MEYEYELIRSERKTVGIQIREGRVIVRAPKRAKKAEIEAVLKSHEGWIEKHLAESQRQRSAAEGMGKLTDEELHALAQEALRVIPARVAYYAPLVGVSYGRITIRCQRTRWGSCTSQGNLNFNCLLMLAPPEVLDSVVVHELCHRKEMNHSKRFYDEIYRVMPDYDTRKKWLKQHGKELLERVE